MALASQLSFFYFVITYVDKTKKLISMLILVRVMGTFLLLAGLILGWFRSDLVILSAVLPIAVTTILLGGVELLIRKLKRNQEAGSQRVD